MGNNSIRRLAAKKRIFAGGANHKHDYSMPINIELNLIDNQGGIYGIRYYRATKCIYCNATIIENWLQAPIVGLPVLRVKSGHKHRIDLSDIYLM